jgi:hypothetical protein
MGNMCWIAILTTAVIAATLVAVLVAAYGILLRVDITVEEASLTRFVLVETTTTSSSSPAALAYNLTLTLAVRNPNWAITIRNRKKLEAACTFDGQTFDRALLAGKGEKQGPRKTKVYHVAVSSAGAAVPALGNAGAAEFRRQNATGFFELKVKVTGWFSYTGRYTRCDVDATCPLKLQLAPPGTKVVMFEKSRCRLAKAAKNC